MKIDKIIAKLSFYLRKKITRKNFLKFFSASLFYLAFGNKSLKYAFASNDASAGRIKKNIRCAYDLILAKGPDPYKNTFNAIEAIGGMKLFVKKNSIVVIKPNMAWDRTPEQAANTNPQVVAALVEMCYEAGAKKVKVFEISCNKPKLTYETSGIAKAARDKGAKVFFANEWDVLKAKFPYKSTMENWPILREAILCDTFINVPVLKHHLLTKLTLSMKNLMGVCGGRRSLMHFGIGDKLVDLTDFLNPELTVIDATRVLIRNGPTGGNLADVIAMNKIIVSTDPTLADSYAAKLLKKDPLTIPYIKAAINRNFGNADISKARIHKI